MSFDSYWDISDNKDWDERITGQHGKSQPIYVMPVTTHFLLNYPTDPEKRKMSRNFASTSTINSVKN